MTVVHIDLCVDKSGADEPGADERGAYCPGLAGVSEGLDGG